MSRTTITTTTRHQRHQHDSPKKNRLIGAIQAGQTVLAASAMVGIPYSTAKKIWEKFQKTGSTHNRPRSGRPPKLTERAKRLIIRAAKANPHLSMEELGRMVDPPVSATTVRRVLDQGRGRRRRGISRRKSKGVHVRGLNQNGRRVGVVKRAED